MKLLKRSVLALLLGVCLVFCVADGFAQSKIPKAVSTVNDFANLLSDGTKQQIEEASVSFYNRCQIPVIVATVNSLDGEDIESYANRMAREWKIAQKGTEKGILILLAKEEREIRIEISEGLEGSLNDAKAGRIIRKYKENLSDGNYDAGILGIFEAVLQEVEEPGSVVEEESEHNKSGLIWTIAVIALLIYFSALPRRRGWLFLPSSTSWSSFNTGFSGSSSSSGSLFGSDGHFGGSSSFGGGGASSKF